MEHMCNVMIHPEQFIGPHCGGEREEEKIKNSIKELVPDLVPAVEQVQQQTQMVQPSMVQQAPFDYNILKGIARLGNTNGCDRTTIRKIRRLICTASVWEMIEDKTIILQLGDEIYELEIDAIGEDIIILGSTELEDKQAYKEGEEVKE